MLVVGADAVDPQPHTAKDADDDGGDWPIQHLAAVLQDARLFMFP